MYIRYWAYLEPLVKRIRCALKPEPYTVKPHPSTLTPQPSSQFPPTLKLARVSAGSQGFEGAARRLATVLQGGTSLPDYSQLDILGVRYKFVNFGAEKSLASLDR